MVRMKKKVFVLMVSRVFPKGHPREGSETRFYEKILSGCGSDIPWEDDGLPKITTIRSNYDLWAKRAEQINAGKAVLSLRQWSGLPYRSKQIEFMQLEKVGIEKVSIVNSQWNGQRIVTVAVESSMRNIDLVAKNDGLSVDDFCKWFKFKDDFEGCVLHFTDFRYGK
jgi:hypothetical protein